MQSRERRYSVFPLSRVFMRLITTESKKRERVG
jgi:hypothetical protein